MTVHPALELLQRYADGSLASAPGLTVAAHLGFCSTCRASVAALEEAEASAMLATQGEALRPGALDDILGVLERPARQAPPRRRSPDLPDAVGHLRLGWKLRFPRGVWLAMARVKRQDDWRLFVVHARAGGVLPIHDHSGPEYTCVLSGAYADRGKIYAAGDFAQAGRETIAHRLEVTSQGPCTCLIAAQGPVRCRGALAAVAPLIGL